MVIPPSGMRRGMIIHKHSFKVLALLNIMVKGVVLDSRTWVHVLGSKDYVSSLTSILDWFPFVAPRCESK